MLDVTQALYVGLLGAGIGLVVVLVYLLIRTAVRWVMNNPKESNTTDKRK